MARYFFDLYQCGTHTPDDEGHDLGGIDGARLHAVAGAREIMAAEVVSGSLCLSCYIVIEDHHRREVGRVLFKDALIVTGQ